MATLEPGARPSLKDIDTADTGGIDEAAGRARLEALREDLAKLQSLLYAENRHAVLVILQGMDASGKDGTIRNVMKGLNPLGVSVVPFKAPHEEEREHDYLWRVHKRCPTKGEIAIFNRSHYEDVLAVRVKELVPKSVWKKRYRHINEFERMLTDSGTLILKFFLHISKDQQKERFQERLDDPRKYWKFAQDDIDARHLWKDYREAYEDAIEECGTEHAPWTIVPADKKWYRNLVVAERVVEAMKGLGMAYPKATFDRSQINMD